ncbi:DddA-like double-stranded DNA deaminase toxin [Singulisphaera sp. PoT]|uniref:DddA-like double-stranded DNA deaminase toxin n=1 Tax=Singulisphaera sp. PoT TaxID=3411797 RepID=UPI003BF4CDC3
MAVSIKNRRKSLRDHHAKIHSEAKGRISREELRELEKGQSKERKAENEQHSSDADALRDIHRGQDIELASQERKERSSSRSTRRHPNGSSPAGHDPSLRPDDLSSVTHPVTGSQLYLDYIDRYGFQNVEWSRIPDYTGGKTSGVLTLPFGDFFIKSGYSGPTDGVPKKVIPGMNNILKAHVEAHSAVLMRKLDLNYAVLILNRVPCIQGQAKKSGCHFMLPRMLGAGRVLRVIVPQVLDRNYDGINL